jgi:hypothetical protein
VSAVSRAAPAVTAFTPTGGNADIESPEGLGKIGAVARSRNRLLAGVQKVLSLTPCHTRGADVLASEPHERQDQT